MQSTSTAQPADSPRDDRREHRRGEERIHADQQADGDTAERRVRYADSDERQALQDDEEAQDTTQHANNHAGDQGTLHELVTEHLDHDCGPTGARTSSDRKSNSQRYASRSWWLCK